MHLTGSAISNPKFTRHVPSYQSLATKLHPLCDAKGTQHSSERIQALTRNWDAWMEARVRIDCVVSPPSFLCLHTVGQVDGRQIH